MDDRSFFELEDEQLSPEQLSFLAALRLRLGERIHPYCAEFENSRMLIALDVDAPDVALMTVGLELVGSRLRGDRISIHDRSFPNTPTTSGFVVEGTAQELARRGAELFEHFVRRPVVRHEWLHRRKVYATCYLFEDSGERLSQMYRSDWAPRGQEAKLIAAGLSPASVMT